MPPHPQDGAASASGAAGPGDVPFMLIAYDEVDSTNTVAKRLCAAEAGDRTLVWARRQTAGRGRLQRSWVSPQGNLYASLILRPAVTPGDATALTFVAAVAVADAIAALLPDGAAVTCKWPNDVLVGGRKIAGILLESGVTASGELDWVVVGIGINVGSHPPSAEVMYPATSFAGEGHAGTGVEAVLDGLCRWLDHWLQRWADEGFTAVRTRWLSRAHGIGQPIAVGCGDGPVRGIFRGLDETGALLVERDGAVLRVRAGDVLAAPHRAD